MNKKIIYIRSYGGNIIPIDKVNLVTLDPNTQKIVQELPLSQVLEHLYRLNQHFIVSNDKDWHHLEDYNLIQHLK